MSDSRGISFDLSEKFPCLKRAPIVEAVVHWTTLPARAFDPETFRTRIVESLSDYLDVKPVRAFRIAAQFDAEGVSTSSRDESWIGWRLTSADGRNVAQFNVDGFIFSRLAPYEEWQAFATEALRLWKVYVKAAEPSEVQRLGVRFINRISPIAIADVETLLVRPPVRLKSLGLPVREFLYQSSHEVPGHPYRLNIVDTIQPENQTLSSGQALILDVDAFTIRPTGLDDAEMIDHLNRLRWLKNKAFFSLIEKSEIDRFQPESS